METLASSMTSSWECLIRYPIGRANYFPVEGKSFNQTIAQAAPAYAMSVFRIPLGLCADIQKAIARFW